VLGRVELVVGRQQAIEHARDLGREMHLETRRRAVDADEPRAELGERAAQLLRRRVPLEEVRLEPARELLVLGAS
jgi:hypothetical protein